MAEEGATVIINSDAHLPESIVQRIDDALTLCDRCGITPAMFTDVKNNRLVG